MRVSELCKRADVSKELVRHYEAIGLISSSEEQAGSRVYRQFSEETVERLRLIKKAKLLGLSLKEIRPLLDAFVGGEMLRSQAIELLEKRDQHMLEIIDNAEEVRARIAQSLLKLQEEELLGCLTKLSER